MAILDIIVKIMPDSLEVNLDKVKKKIILALEDDGAREIIMNEESVAFGLKAVIVGFKWDESKDTVLFENSLEKIEGVSSASTQSANRAFG